MKKGQSSSFDIVVILISITLFIAFITSFKEDKVIRIASERARNDYTHSLLLSMLYLSVNNSKEFYSNKFISELLVMYFLNPEEFNLTLRDEIKRDIEKYFEDKNIEWVLYGSVEKRVLWLPSEKILSGKDVSSSSVELILPSKEKVRIFLWVKY